MSKPDDCRYPHCSALDEFTGRCCAWMHSAECAADEKAATQDQQGIVYAVDDVAAIARVMNENMRRAQQPGDLLSWLPPECPDRRLWFVAPQNPPFCLDGRPSYATKAKLARPDGVVVAAPNSPVAKAYADRFRRNPNSLQTVTHDFGDGLEQLVVYDDEVLF